MHVIRPGALALLCALQFACSAAEASSMQVRLTWQRSPQTTMTVTWHTAEPTGQVDYGADASYGASSPAISTAYAGGYQHTVELTGLTPNTTYHYRCGTQASWSPDYTFTTAPAPGASFRFAAWGDSRTNDAARAQVRSAISASQPAFSITTGDLVESGTDQGQWDQWFATMQPLTAVSPTFTIVGNHEGDVSQYYAQWPMPVHPSAAGYHDRAYYSFDYGNTHFVGLDSNAMVGGAQQAWLEQDLQEASSRPEIRWIVAFAHHPPYSSGSHGSDLEVRNAWNPLFEKYGVIATFWGHDHSYERSKPMKNGIPSAEGTTYVVTGGAGAPLYGVGQSSWTAFSRTSYHFVEVGVTQDSFTMQTRDPFGAVFDSVTFIKPPVGSTDGTEPAGGDGPAGEPGGGQVAPPETGGSCTAGGVGAVVLPVVALLGLPLLLRRRRRAR